MRIFRGGDHSLPLILFREQEGEGFLTAEGYATPHPLPAGVTLFDATGSVTLIEDLPAGLALQASEEASWALSGPLYFSYTPSRAILRAEETHV